MNSCFIYRPFFKGIIKSAIVNKPIYLEHQIEEVLERGNKV